MTAPPSIRAERPEERYVAAWQNAWSYGTQEPCLREHGRTIRGDQTL